MALIQSVTVGNRVINLYTFTGEVLEEKKWSTTQVSGGGGGYNVGSGQQNPVSISSSTTTHDQFFLRDDAGQEKAFETSNAGLALRKGHRVTVLWGIIQGNNSGPNLAIYNHSTGDLTRFDGAIGGLSATAAPSYVIWLTLLGIPAICLYGLGIIMLAVAFYGRSQHKKQQNALRATFQPAVEAVIAQIKGQK